MPMVTKKKAETMLKYWKNDTNYFNGILTFDGMLDMLVRMRFGRAEAHTILAALVLAGAKFQENMEDEVE